MLQPFGGGGAHDDTTVGPLPGLGGRSIGERATPRTAAEHQAQAVRPTWSDDVFDHLGPTVTFAPARMAAPPGTFAPMKLVDAVSLRSRKRKLRLFREALRPTAETSILDVGVDEASFGEAGGHSGCGTHNFFEEYHPWRARITALGLHEGTAFRRRYPEIAYVQGDACALPFADQSFDIVFSNAVIEHVGDHERQQLFVSEALRVGRRVFLTTPNKWFPVEVHTRLPLVHWLPPAAAGRAYDLAGMRWARENHLLGRRDLRALFPGEVRIVNLGLTLVAIT